MLSRYIVPCLIALSLAPAALANNETRIRQAGQNLEVRGSRSGVMFFTVTGFPGDVMNSPFANGTLWQLRNNARVSEVVHHSGGQISLRFCIINPRLVWSGQNVSVSRRGSLIDRDRIIITP